MASWHMKMKMMSMAMILGACAATAASDSDALSFLIMGDWGGSVDPPYTTAAEIATAGGMQKVAASMTPTPQFALGLGDNFYDAGINGDANSPRFDATFENVFTGENLKDPFQFNFIAGNHDHKGNVTAQIARTGISKRWNFPDMWYTFTKGGGALPTVQFILIDTVLISGSSDIYNEEGRLVQELPGSQLPGPDNQALADAQLAWLNATLANSSADYIIVGGHYPAYSICEHGPTPTILASVKPALEAYKVTAYVNGHDHCMEYINDGSIVDYHTIGSAHLNDDSTQHASFIPKGSLKFHTAGKLGGFASVVATKDGLTVTHRDGDGTVVYTAPPHPPRQSSRVDVM